jgi:uncharacterized protein
MIERIWPAVLLVLLAAGTVSAQGEDAERPRRVLFLTHSAGFVHPVLPTAEAVVAQLSEANDDLEIVSWNGHTQAKDEIDLSGLTRDLFGELDGVMFFTTGELPLTDEQKQALLDFVAGGGAFIGVHSATDTFYEWPEYGELVGGYFRTHSWNHLPLTLKVEDEEHPATSMLGEEWTLADEFYRFGMTEEEAIGPVVFSRERVHVLLSIDTEKSDIDKQRCVIPGRFDVMEAGRDYPLAWCREYGEGRSFYTALGHREDVWESERFQQHLLGGLRWALRTAGE